MDQTARLPTEQETALVPSHLIPVLVEEQIGLSTTAGELPEHLTIAGELPEQIAMPVLLLLQMDTALLPPGHVASELDEQIGSTGVMPPIPPLMDINSARSSTSGRQPT